MDVKKPEGLAGLALPDEGETGDGFGHSGKSGLCREPFCRDGAEAGRGISAVSLFQTEIGRVGRTGLRKRKASLLLKEPDGSFRL